MNNRDNIIVMSSNMGANESKCSGLIPVNVAAGEIRAWRMDKYEFADLPKVGSVNVLRHPGKVYPDATTVTKFAICRTCLPNQYRRTDIDPWSSEVRDAIEMDSMSTMFEFIQSYEREGYNGIVIYTPHTYINEKVANYARDLLPHKFVIMYVVC